LREELQNCGSAFGMSLRTDGRELGLLEHGADPYLPGSFAGIGGGQMDDATTSQSDAQPFGLFFLPGFRTLLQGAAGRRRLVRIDFADFSVRSRVSRYWRMVAQLPVTSSTSITRVKSEHQSAGLQADARWRQTRPALANGCVLLNDSGCHGI
jgi:hypothetical protein